MFRLLDVALNRGQGREKKNMDTHHLESKEGKLQHSRHLEEITNLKNALFMYF